MANKRRKTEVAVNNLQTTLRINLPRVRTLVRTVLDYNDIESAEISVTFVSRQKMQALNRKYHKRSHATDVLSFDLSPAGAGRRNKKKANTLAGEIVVSTDAAKKNARIFNSDPATEISLYVTHGILHLLGYDDRAPRDIRKMRSQENKVLEFLGKRRVRAVLM